MSKFEDDFLKFVDTLYALTDAQHKEVLLAYLNSLDNIRQLIAQLYMQYAVDGKLNMVELNKYNRLMAIEKKIMEEVKNLGTIELKQVNLILPEIYKQAYYQSAYIIESTAQTAISFTLLKPEFVKEAVTYNWSGVPFSERIWSNHDSLVRSLRTELTRGIIEGESIDKVARRMKKTFDSKAYESRRLIRTESSRVISAAQDKIYNDSAVVEELIFTATLDSQTTYGCRKLDGKRFKKDDPNKPTLPRHVNCRSCYIPYIEGLTYRTRKDNESKKLTTYKNYDEWYNNKVKK